jgi:ribosomal protein S18 acetylase RimI-like enzyme
MANSNIQVENQLDIGELIEYFETLDEDYINQLKREVKLDEYSEKLIAKSRKIILRVDSKVVATLFYYENSENIFISHLSVCKLSEGQGLGRRLFDLLKLQVGLRVVVLEVNSNNGKAQRFYETIGFREKSNSESKSVMELLWT